MPAPEEPALARACYANRAYDVAQLLASGADPLERAKQRAVPRQTRVGWEGFDGWLATRRFDSDDDATTV